MRARDFHIIPRQTCGKGEAERNGNRKGCNRDLAIPETADGSRLSSGALAGDQKHIARRTQTELESSNESYALFPVSKHHSIRRVDRAMGHESVGRAVAHRDARASGSDESVGAKKTAASSGAATSSTSAAASSGSTAASSGSAPASSGAATSSTSAA
ncbi:MAG: hypothetical protein WA280_19235, partial [Xanthobacteraceae bacterium]